jgi:ABC-type Fe3+ transport system substrate-binding protein
MGDYHMSGSPVTRGVAKEGHYENYVPMAVQEPGVKWHVDPLMDQKEKVFQGKAFPIAVSPDPNGVAVNTKLVPENKMPKTFKDFLDPFFRGKISFQDPRVPGPGNLFYLYMKKLYGQEFMEKLKAHNVTIERSYPIGIRAVASGEFLLFIGVAARMMKEMEQAPIELLYPEGVVPSITQIGILKGCPHPNAAKLFMNFALSQFGQEMGAKFADRTPVRADAKGMAKVADLTGRKVLPLLTFEEDVVMKGEMQKEAKKLFGE